MTSYLWKHPGFMWGDPALSLVIQNLSQSAAVVHAIYSTHHAYRFHLVVDNPWAEHEQNLGGPLTPLQPGFT